VTGTARGHCPPQADSMSFFGIMKSNIKYLTLIWDSRVMEGYVMNNKVEIVKLTSAEISALWTANLNISVVICLMTHFIETCKDPEILTLLEETKHLAEKHMNQIDQLFIKEKIIIPEGFKVEKHVVPNAAKLFSDLYYIQCTLQISKFGLASHSSIHDVLQESEVPAANSWDHGVMDLTIAPF
jgi:Protein of unknown function (DUF3231)